MKFRNLFAGMLAVTVMCGAPAFAEEQPQESTAAPTQAPSATPEVTATSEAILFTLAPSETPAETEQPTAEPSETPAETEQPTAEPSETPAETEQPTAEPSETPAETEQPIAEIVVPAYINVKADTDLYSDWSREHRIGKLTQDSVLLVTSVDELETGYVLSVKFDTEETLESEICASAYLRVAELLWLTESELIAFTQECALREPHMDDEFAVPLVEFEAAKPAETEAPTPEPTELPELDENLIPDETPAPTPSELPALEEELIPDAPTQEPTEAPVEEDKAEGETDEEEMEIVEDVPLNRFVSVSAAYNTETLQLGSEITLTAQLSGYENAAVACVWQYAAANSEGEIIGEWQDSENTDLSFTYELTAENLLTAWRMSVTVIYE